MKQVQILAIIQAVEDNINRTLTLTRSETKERLKMKPSEEGWSALQVLCHMEEVIPYWMNELERVIGDQGGEWGRGLQDEHRLKAVNEADGREIESVFLGLEAAGQSARQKLLNLKDDDLVLQAPHRNPKFGTKSMSFLLDHFVVEHLEKHFGQIDRTLKAISMRE